MEGYFPGNKAGLTVLSDEIVEIWGPRMHQKYLFEAKFLFSVTHHGPQKVLDDVRVCLLPDSSCCGAIRLA